MVKDLIPVGEIVRVKHDLVDPDVDYCQAGDLLIVDSNDQSKTHWDLWVRLVGVPHGQAVYFGIGVHEVERLTPAPVKRERMPRERVPV